MPYDLQGKLVIAISSRALFNLDAENQLFEKQGLLEYRAHQISHENVPLEPGTGFPLVRSLLRINQLGRGDLIEVVLVSRNDADTGLRVMNSVEHYGLAITRAGFTNGRAPYRYLQSFSCDLFLSAKMDDVTDALRAGYAAGLVYAPPVPLDKEESEVRIAFDGDAVLFSPESERIYKEKGLLDFHQNERDLADVPLGDGPFKGFLKKLHGIQQQFPDVDGTGVPRPIRTALVTARNAPAHKRAINTLRAWNVRIDEAFFLGGVTKKGVLEVFQPHIFFDDQDLHCQPVFRRTPTAQVPIDDAGSSQIIVGESVPSAKMTPAELLAPHGEAENHGDHHAEHLGTNGAVKPKSAQAGRRSSRVTKNASQSRRRSRS